MSNVVNQIVAEGVAAEQLEDVSPKTLREISDGENFSASTKYLGGKKVTATYSFKPHSKGRRYEKTTLFDFGNVTEEQLYLLAMYGVKVTVQHILRNLKPADMLNPETLSNIDVRKTVVDGSRPSGNPTTVARKALLRMSHEERMALMAEMSQSDEDATDEDGGEEATA